MPQILYTFVWLHSLKISSLKVIRNIYCHSFVLGAISHKDVIRNLLLKGNINNSMFIKDLSR
jgi:hypothetical protein